MSRGQWLAGIWESGDGKEKNTSLGESGEKAMTETC